MLFFRIQSFSGRTSIHLILFAAKATGLDLNICTDPTFPLNNKQNPSEKKNAF